MRNVWFYYNEIHIYVTTSQSGDEGKCDTQIDNRKHIHIDLIRQIERPLVTETTHPIILGFSWIRTQS